MADEEIQEMKTENKSKIYLQLVASFIVNLALLCCGAAAAWIHTGLPELEKETPKLFPTDSHKIAVYYALAIGTCLGPIVPALLLNRVGRKWVLYATAFPLIASWILIFFAKSWAIVLGARLAAGLSVGAIFLTAPVYLGEIVETKIRGASIGMMLVLFNLGYLYMYAIGPLVNSKMVAGFNIIPLAVFLIVALYLPESPYYNLLKKEDKSATLSLVWLRRSVDPSDKVQKIKVLIESESSGGLSRIYTSHKKPLLLLLLLLGAQQLSGFAAIQSSSNDLLNDLYLKFDKHDAILILCTCCLMISIVASGVVDRLGRKPILLISSYGSTLSLLAIGAYFLLLQLKINISNLSILPIVAIPVYFVCFSFGLAVVPLIIASEIFPLSLKVCGIAIAVVFKTVLSVIVMLTYQAIVQHLGYYIIFLVLGVIQLILAIVATIVVPETSRKSFKSIQETLSTTTEHTKKPKIKKNKKDEAEGSQ